MENTYICSSILPHPIVQENNTIERILSEEEKKKLSKDKTLLSKFKQDKLELEAQKNWDLFYKRNATRFFKDRHWTHREFSELSLENLSRSSSILLEVGCGCGNAIFPLIVENPNIFVYACDFSSRAVEFVKGNHLYNEEQCCAFQCDLTKNQLSGHISENSVDMTSMIFVLSAISPSNMRTVLLNIYKVLKPGGVILFRDYGLYDHAMLRFAPGHKLDDNFYVRQDGTRAYYFSLEFTKDLFSSVGFQIIDNRYVHKRTVNKKEGIDVPRVFVQGKYAKIG